MTDNLPSDQKRRQTPPVNHKAQGGAGQTHRTTDQIKKNNAAGNHPAVQRGRAQVSARPRNAAPQKVQHSVPQTRKNSQMQQRPAQAKQQTRQRAQVPQTGQHAQVQQLARQQTKQPAPQNRRPVQQKAHGLISFFSGSSWYWSARLPYSLSS